MYIYLSNEIGTPVEVFFDDFKVEQIKSPVIQTNDYYPFGLAFNSYLRENSLDQKYLYNGKELQDELNLGWLDYGARAFMPDIGRWTTLDPLLEKFNSFSPYSYCLNNPIVLVDPDGMASRYNWETNTYYDDEDDDGQQDDGERTTTWGQVQKEYGIGAMDGNGSSSSASTSEQNGGGEGRSAGARTNAAQQAYRLQWGTSWVGRNNIISSNEEARDFYENGDGSPRLIDQNSALQALATPEFLRVINRLVSGKAQRITGTFDVDMTSRVFHIGNTNVDYETTINGTTATTVFRLFVRDGFWDPNFILEALSGLNNNWRPDGMGPNLETEGGQPYEYEPVILIMRFTNPGTYDD